MTVNPCPQSPLVEAFEDGRLRSSDRASIERHLGACATCAAEKHHHDRIREALRAPRETATPLEHQRARGALLRAAAVNQGATPAPGLSRRPSFLMCGFAAMFIAAALGVGWMWGRSSAPRMASTAAPPVTFVDTSVVPSDGARFERTRGGGVDTVTLSSGTLAVSTGTKTNERLIVKTIDAVLEAKESAFHVEADAGRIRNVVVERGTVEVRYAGFIAVIPAGGSWHGTETASVDPAPPAVASASPILAPAPVLSPVPVPVPAPVSGRAPVLATPPGATAEPPAASAALPPPPPPSGRAFSNAMHTLERGDFDGAASALGAFADAHPEDPRSDDADYVRAIALQRAGHVAEAKAAAQRYLANRPNGAHRREAEQIANR